MLFLLVVPVMAAVALVHRHLQIYAPTNVLSRKVRRSTPSLRAAGGLLALSMTLLLLMHALAVAIGVGAPRWLNLVVLLLAWDAIRIGILTLLASARLLAATCLRVRGRRDASTMV